MNTASILREDKLLYKKQEKESTPKIDGGCASGSAAARCFGGGRVARWLLLRTKERK